ncbi:rhodanese-like domain-containing protein [Maritimibacter sp. DP1N21-5]|uniref:rhodanese-like domain-containing protein n=1 Tax=Maritimibacter sp. DP1N21-5 TaxID=2836867 RepID=UPI001C493D91|nr:rhodanese-like domain-containing protein [Maritimibacter sp. DP1N21-5]MBV7410569.1 rhodanese-like domain-containing protein [Maritimibacter sp. DP1N21-5]
MPARRLVLVLTVATVVAGGALAVTRGAPEFDQRFLTVEEMQSREALVVDIRTPSEWVETGVIDGARLVTFDDPQSFLAQIRAHLAPGQDLVLVCRSGNRTRAAASALAPLIDNPITSVEGGMKALIARGYRPVAPS